MAVPSGLLSAAKAALSRCQAIRVKSRPEFAAIFGTKEVLDARFGQLAELRNAIRHSRTTNEVTIKDGEAALLWFSQVFAALDRASDPRETA